MRSSLKDRDQFTGHDVHLVFVALIDCESAEIAFSH